MGRYKQRVASLTLSLNRLFMAGRRCFVAPYTRHSSPALSVNHLTTEPGSTTLLSPFSWKFSARNEIHFEYTFIEENVLESSKSLKT